MFHSGLCAVNGFDSREARTFRFGGLGFVEGNRVQGLGF